MDTSMGATVPECPCSRLQQGAVDEQLSDLSGAFLINHCLGPMETDHQQPIPELESRDRIAIVAVMCMTCAMLLCYKSAASLNSTPLMLGIWIRWRTPPMSWSNRWHCKHILIKAPEVYPGDYHNGEE